MTITEAKQAEDFASAVWCYKKGHFYMHLYWDHTENYTQLVCLPVLEDRQC